jgi:hypothetical protein
MSGIAGVGTQFRRWNSATDAWERIAEVTNIDWSGMERATKEDTPLDVAGGYETFIGGLRKAGELKLAMNFTRDTYEVMLADFNNDARQNYELILPDDDQTSFEFEGLVKSMPLKVDKTLITADVSIQISGQPTINSGSGPSPG